VRLARRIRTAPLLIVDDAVVALPLSDADLAAGVLTVHDQTITSLINALAGQVWSETCALVAISPQGGGLSAGEAALLRLVGSGLTDEAAARRLGLSLRTVARMMSRIMDRLNASSRFQAGMRAQNLGWLDGLDEISMKEIGSAA
jgi:DNA-binding NarL/FixJ family response regulator